VRIPFHVGGDGIVGGTPGLSLGGPAGNIDVNVDELVMQGPGQISTASLGTGSGGSVSIRARRSVLLSGGASIASRAGGSDPAGNATLRSGGTIDLRDSLLAAEANAVGGNLTVSAGGLFITRNSTLSAKAGRLGAQSAQIVIESPVAVALSNSTINGLVSSVTVPRAVTSGGDVPVIINTPSLLATSSFILSDTQSTPTPIDVTAAIAALRAVVGSPPQMADFCARTLAPADTSSFTLEGIGARSVMPEGFSPVFSLESQNR
jgi:hypothetical protein